MKLLPYCFLCFVSICAKSDILRELSKDGIPAKVTVSICDQLGNPVPDAQIVMAFGYSSGRKSNIIKTITNKEGIAFGENKTNNRIAIHVTKDGFYKSFLEYSVWKGSTGYESGRWEPWNPTLTIMLRKISKPNKTERRHKAFHNLDPSEKYTFDFQSGEIKSCKDVQSPLDFVVSIDGSFYTQNISRKDDWIATSSITFPRDGCGIIERKKDKISSFCYEYYAPCEGYVPYVEYSSIKEKGRIISRKDYPSETYEYLVFRISRENELGSIDYFYGVIDSWSIGKDWKTGKIGFSIMYRLNTEPGNRNIEYN